MTIWDWADKHPIAAPPLAFFAMFFFMVTVSNVANAIWRKR